MVLSVACSHNYRQGRTALADVDVTLPAGTTGLLGVNGAGKTTLLKIMAGALRPSEGDASLEGRSLYGPERRGVLGRVGYMPQDFRVPDKTKVRDVLVYLGWMRGMSRARASEAAGEMLEAVGLTAQADSRMNALSGGMRRRVGFAQSLIADPEVLLLDEPTTGLDPEQRAGVRDIVAAQSQRSTTVISSHLIEDVSMLANHLVVLEQGRVLFDGPMADFRRLSSGSDEERFLQLVANGRRQ